VRRIKMKLGKIAATVAAGALLLSAVSVAPPAAASGTVLVWADKGTIDTITPKVAAFNSNTGGVNPTGIHINLVSKDFSTVRDALKTAVAHPSANTPDILAGAAHDWIGNLVAANVLMPIDSQLPANFKDDFIPGALQAMKYNGHYYGVPGWTENIAILRNISKAPHALTSVNQIKNGELGVNYSATTSDPYHLYPFQTMFNAPVFTSDSSGDWTNTVGMGGANGAAFATWLKSKGTKFFGPPANAKLLCNFLNGKIKYWVTGPWNINAIESGASGCKTGLKVNTGYAIDSFPKGPTGITPHQFLGIRGYLMVASQPGNVTNVPDATKFMRYMSSESVQYSLFDNFNKFPANKAALNRAKSDPVIAGFANAANTVPMPNSPAMDAAWVIWGKAQTRIIQGKEANAPKAWASMVSALQKAINKIQ
jgi:arabinogalactan oligomer/maltooligosaccharide transport system substrate-binding protein